MAIFSLALIIHQWQLSEPVLYELSSVIVIQIVPVILQESHHCGFSVVLAALQVILNGILVSILVLNKLLQLLHNWLENGLKFTSDVFTQKSKSIHTRLSNFETFVVHVLI